MYYIRTLFGTEFKVLKITQLLCIAYVILLTLSPTFKIHGTVNADGTITSHGRKRAIVWTTPFQRACLIIARLSAFYMYPALVVVYLSKLRAIFTYLEHTPIAMFLSSDPHALHVYCGYTIVVGSFIHVIAHVVRWILEHDLMLLFHNYEGITGLVITISLILIALPMMFGKQTIQYEIRKYIHYFFILFALAMCFHVPVQAIPNGGFAPWIFSFVLAIYVLDSIIVHFFMTEKVNNATFQVWSSGTQLTMQVSTRFQRMGPDGGYCYVCLPWISKYEWHAFSLFEDKSNAAERHVFMFKSGDWTSKLQETLSQRNTSRPVWIQGPFPSPFSAHSNLYDNQILVATGIGITPSLSIIRASKGIRRSNFIWIVRDIHVLKFFLTHVPLESDGWILIFYTGKDSLSLEDINQYDLSKISIVQSRPDFSILIPNIIYGIESGKGPLRNSSSSIQKTRFFSFKSSFKGISSSKAKGDPLPIAENTIIPQLTEPQDPSASNGGAIELGLSGQITSSKAFTTTTTDHDENVLKASSNTMIFQPWKPHDDSDTIVRRLDRDLVLSTWGMLYCGGSKEMESNLSVLAKQYKIGFHAEAMAW